jgi:subtilisin-like proprotein convertase family protein
MSRAAFGLALLLTIGMGMAPGGLDGGTPVSAKAKAKAKTRTVTEKFANGASVAIPGSGTAGKGNPYPLTIEVSGFKKGVIKDVDLTLRGLSHQHSNDIDVLLVAPNGRNVIPFSEVGDHDPIDNLTITLDDEAPSALEEEVFTSGRFRPTNLDTPHDPDSPDVFPDAPTPSGKVSLSTFDGGNPNGQWRLFVVDNSSDDAGTLANGAQLTIKAETQVKSKKKHHRH